MSFWNTSDGSSAAENASTTYEAGGNDFPIIPEKTVTMSYIHSASWATNNNGDRYINIRWGIVAPEAYEKNVVFQKLWVKDPNPQWKPNEVQKKRDSALVMLATIDANAGGKLARNGREPDDDDLALALSNKKMKVRFMVWDIDGKQGNWVAAVGPKDGDMKVSHEPEVKGFSSGGANRPSGPKESYDLNDDIPF